MNGHGDAKQLFTYESVTSCNRPVALIPQCSNPTRHHFVTEMCIVGYLSNALWDLWDGSISHKHHFADLKKSKVNFMERIHFLDKLDESTARRQLKSPQSLPGRSIHLNLVTKWSTSFVQCQSALPFWDTISKFDHENPWSRSSVWSKVKVTFDLQNSKVKVMVKFKPIGHIWGLEFNRYDCFSFRGNLTIFGWDIANSIFDLENSRSRSWPRSNPMVKFEP